MALRALAARVQMLPLWSFLMYKTDACSKRENLHFDPRIWRGGLQVTAKPLF